MDPLAGTIFHDRRDFAERVTSHPSAISSALPIMLAGVAQACFLDELDHLPVGDEISLCIARAGEEAAGDRQPTEIGSR
jgi:hypothetical protein